MSKMHSGRFRISDLRLVGRPPPPDVPPLAMGERCRLNSGGPALLVVDVNGDDLTLSWQHEETVSETVLPRCCVRRIAS